MIAPPPRVRCTPRAFVYRNITSIPSVWIGAPTTPTLSSPSSVPPEPDGGALRRSGKELA